MLKNGSLPSFFPPAICLVLLSFVVALAQNSSSPVPPQTARVSCDLQLQLLLASNDGRSKGNLPPTLEPTVRQLKSSLSFTNYRVVATFLNRIRDGGTLEAKGILPSGTFAPDPANSTSPIFYEFTLFGVKLDTDTSEQLVQINRLRFGLQVPIVSGTSRNEGSSTGFPAINYNPVGLTTEVNFREGVPTVVGTISANRQDEMLVLIVSVKRTP